MAFDGDTKVRSGLSIHWILLRDWQRNKESIGHVSKQWQEKCGSFTVSKQRLDKVDSCFTFRNKKQEKWNNRFETVDSLPISDSVFFSEKQKKTRKLLTLYFQLMARSNAPHRSRLTSSVYVIWVSKCKKILQKNYLFSLSPVQFSLWTWRRIFRQNDQLHVMVRTTEKILK